MSTETRLSNRKIALGEATKKALINKARHLFQSGYENVSTPDIVASVGVTRGALYHHFRNKRGLFAAVVEAVAADIVKQIHTAASIPSASPIDGIVKGSLAFLKACLNLETRQIFLVDAPAVLGWQEWRRIDALYGLGSLKDGLAECAEAGLLQSHQVEAVAHLISGAVNEAAFLLADRGQQKGLMQETERQMEKCIRAFFRPCTKP